jgi:uncharacterized phage protein (TIGR01671 family)
LIQWGMSSAINFRSPLNDIRFRAWNKKTGKMLLPRGLVELILDLHQWSKVIDHLEVLEFTGLTDRNGIPIFEGDILLASEWEKGSPVGRRERWVVQIDPHYSNGWARTRKGESYCLTAAIEDDEEVIGNLFENPDLLKA